MPLPDAPLDGRLTWGPVVVRYSNRAPADDSALDPLGQRHRLRALRGERAARFVLSRTLILELMRTVPGPADRRIRTDCERCGAEHGRVRDVAGRLALSVSYAGSLAVVAAAPAADAAHLGVDVEARDAATAARVAELDRVLPGAADIARWTRIEAALKADGSGLRVDPATVRIDPDGRTRFPGAPALRVATLDAVPGHWVSVAVSEAAPR